MRDETLLEMTGSVEQVIFRNEKNEYTVLELNNGQEMVTVVGTMPWVSCGEELHVVGTWVNHPNFGPQFKVQAYERFRPATSSAILKYLSSGAIKGIGQVTAAKIVDAFGEHTLDVIEKEPERLCTIKGITRAKANKIAEEFRRIYGIREIMLYLSKFGITPEEAVRIWKIYGPQSADLIQEDPYCLCADGLDIDFERADSIAESMDRPQDDFNRVRAGVVYVLKHNSNNGHTCLPEDKLVPTASRLLAVEGGLVQTALEDLKTSGALISRCFQDRKFVFMPKFYKAEVYTAGRLLMMLRYPAQSIIGIEGCISSIEAKFGLQYADGQKQAIIQALSKGMLILTGGPGTGKTTTLNAIITILEQKGGNCLFSGAYGTSR